MNRYMLDTNIISYMLRGSSETAREKLSEHADDELCISSITYAELRYGVVHSSNPTRNQVALSLFLSGVEILAFDGEASEKYALIWHDLTNRGQLIGANDLLIAAHALAADAVLVTHNVREFERVEGLVVDDWCV